MPVVLGSEDLGQSESTVSKRLVAEGVRSACCVPLLLGDRTLGGLNIGSLQEGAFTTADAELLGAVAKQIALAVAGMRRDAALDRLFALGAPAAHAVRGDDSYDDPFLWENGYFEAYDHPTQGPTIGARTFADFSRTHHVMTKPVPDIGQHTTEVLRSFGIDDRRIINLAAQGVVFGG